MGVNYSPLFHLMLERKMKKKDLREKVPLSPNIVAKFEKNENVSMNTIEKLCTILNEKNPKTIKVCALIDRPDRRIVPVHIDYIGFSVQDKFLVGYGLDYAERYRNLPYIGELTEADK